MIFVNIIRGNLLTVLAKIVVVECVPTINVNIRIVCDIEINEKMVLTLLLGVVGNIQHFGPNLRIVVLYTLI